MTNNVVPLKTGGAISAIVPQSVEEVFRLASCIKASGLAPRGMQTAEQITVAIMTGMELGLPPIQAVNRIAVINGRPCIWGDAVPAMLYARGFKLDEQLIGDVAQCTVTRPDGQAITRTFSVAEAKTAGLWGKSGPWQQYPNRMLQMRARGFAARDGAADVLAGLYIAEEAQDIPLADKPKRKSSAAAKRDGDDKRLESIRNDIKACDSPSDLMRVRNDHKDDFETMPGWWADIIENEWRDKVEDMAGAIVRELESDITACSMPIADVNAKWGDLVMVLPEAERDQAIDMLSLDDGAA